MSTSKYKNLDPRMFASCTQPKVMRTHLEITERFTNLFLDVVLGKMVFATKSKYIGMSWQALILSINKTIITKLDFSLNLLEYGQKILLTYPG